MAELCSAPFCLGLGPEWTACCQKTGEFASEENEATTSESTNDKRFNSFPTDEEADKIAVGYVPRNTEKTTKWALRNFEEWREVRNRRFPSDQVRSDLLTNSSMESSTLFKWLSHFVVETRNGRGEEYTPATLNQLLASLLRHMRAHNNNAPNFMDKKNTEFQRLHGTLDNTFRKLHQNGIGRKLKQR